MDRRGKASKQKIEVLKANLCQSNSRTNQIRLDYDTEINEIRQQSPVENAVHFNVCIIKRDPITLLRMIKNATRGKLNKSDKMKKILLQKNYRLNLFMKKQNINSIIQMKYSLTTQISVNHYFLIYYQNTISRLMMQMVTKNNV